MDLLINSKLVIPAKEINWKFSRSSGPGGQNVNKTESKVELLFDLGASSVMSSDQKNLLRQKYLGFLVNDCIRIVVQKERAQHRNRQVALLKLRSLIIEGLTLAPKSRKVTKPTFASKQRRVDFKKYTYCRRLIL